MNLDSGSPGRSVGGWRKGAFNLGLLLVSVSVVLVCAELSLRWFYPRSDRYLVLPANQRLVQEPSEENLPGVSGPAEYRTSSWGIRGAEFGEDGSEYRILAIGGSTTQNAYLDQTETWTLLLGDLLGPTASGRKTWTGDVGRSGHTARSHVLQLEVLLSQLPTIDAVVMLVGVNDLTVALREGFSYSRPLPLSDPDAARRQMQEAFLQVPGGLHERLTAYQAEGVPWFKRLALYHLTRLVYSTARQSMSGLDQDPLGAIYPTWRRHRAEASVMWDTLPDLTQPLEDYRGLLESMVATAGERGTRLIFLTQPTLWRSDLTPDEEAALWLGGMGDFQEEAGHEYFSAGALAKAMDAYNATLLDVCVASGVECIDVAGVLPKDLSIFYDDVHFTERGSRLVAEAVGAYLSARPPYVAAEPLR